MDLSWNFMGKNDSLICLLCQMSHFSEHYLAQVHQATCVDLPKKQTKTFQSRQWTAFLSGINTTTQRYVRILNTTYANCVRMNRLFHVRTDKGEVDPKEWSCLVFHANDKLHPWSKQTPFRDSAVPMWTSFLHCELDNSQPVHHQVRTWRHPGL